jgi:DNA-binding response OmpR family regulator
MARPLRNGSRSAHRRPNVETISRRGNAPINLIRTLDARLELSSAAGERLLVALQDGVHDFVLSSRDGSMSAKLRLSLPPTSISEHRIGGSTVFIDWSAATVALGQSRASLSRTELRLLAALLEGEGQPMSRADLIRRVWPADELELADRENALGVYICSLRKRLSMIGAGSALATVRYVGYLIAT